MITYVILKTINVYQYETIPIARNHLMDVVMEEVEVYVSILKMESVALNQYHVSYLHVDI